MRETAKLYTKIHFQDLWINVTKASQIPQTIFIVSCITLSSIDKPLARPCPIPTSNHATDFPFAKQGQERVFPTRKSKFRCLLVHSADGFQYRSILLLFMDSKLPDPSRTNRLWRSIRSHRLFPKIGQKSIEQKSIELLTFHQFTTYCTNIMKPLQQKLQEFKLTKSTIIFAIIQ